MKFTPETVAGLSLPAGKSEHFEWDGSLPSFGVRLRRNSKDGISKHWVIQYRIGLQQRRESLGDIRKVTLETARKIARQRFAQVELNIDPVAQRRQAHAKAAAAKLTLAVAADRYLDDRQAVIRPNTFKALQMYFAVHWKPLRNRPIDGDGQISRSDIAARIQELTKVHGRIAAARARDYLISFYNWSQREGLCSSNPAALTNDPGAGIPSRDRVLSDHEIGVIWRACKDENNNFSRVVQLLLLTGCRREEIARLRWSELNVDTGALTISGERTKNRRTLELTLPPLAMEILQSQVRRADHDYVFGGRAGFCGYSYYTMALKTRIAEQGSTIAAWRLHDLRRTFRSGLGRLGVAPHVAELCINHVKSGVEAIYDRYQYQRETTLALRLWSDHVAAIAEGGKSNIVALRQA
jgi:integrase